jgi:hypothetical protein
MGMRGVVAFALSGLCVVAPVAAQTMNAESFHKRAEALRKKGPLALFSKGEINALMSEAKAAGHSAREARLATIKAGGKARYCPPEGQYGMGSNEFMAQLGAIPAAQRARIDMTEAMVRILARKFPC